eukprot:TRINITY_DN15641_c0_g1_i1.p1 TRINITY_DN15641_c0_g1~~TRINITY_DN15641_c0_g1_i1.p1  ORF type:complete len:135 (-),score=1.91 TRINITY_DN15641_c0_g1_i1:31-435(-)
MSSNSQNALQQAALGVISKSKASVLADTSESPTANTISRSTHPDAVRIDLLSEYGYHWCPVWSGDGWCPEGYLCGDGNNGCEWNTCCNDDPSLISCPSSDPNSQEVLTPCGIHNIPVGGLVGDYICCDLTENLW